MANTNLKISPPKNKSKGAPPPETKPSANLKKTPSSISRNLNFKISAEFYREFKGLAVEQDMKLNELLEACFRHYEESTK